MTSVTVTATEARKRLSKLIEQVSTTGDTFIVTKFGKPMAIIVPPVSFKESSTKEVLQWTRGFIKRYRTDLEALSKMRK